MFLPPATNWKAVLACLPYLHVIVVWLLLSMLSMLSMVQA